MDFITFDLLVHWIEFPNVSTTNWYLQNLSNFVYHHWGLNQFIGHCLIPLDPWEKNTFYTQKHFLFLIIYKVFTKECIYQSKAILCQFVSVCFENGCRIYVDDTITGKNCRQFRLQFPPEFISRAIYPLGGKKKG